MERDLKRNFIALAGAGLAIAINPLSASALTAGEVFGAIIGGALGAVGAAAVGNSQPSNSKPPSNNPTGYQDLIGVRGRDGETQLQARGYQLRGGEQTGSDSYTYWTQVSTNQCIVVRTNNGRYASITPASSFDCNNAGDNDYAQQLPAAANPAQPSIQCTFGGQPQTCTIQTSFSQAGTGVDVQFPDGFVRKMTFSGGDFYADGQILQDTRADSQFFYVKYGSGESFVIPRNLLN